jgi:tetratricopeptide (TPR) repeat protein
LRLNLRDLRYISLFCSTDINLYLTKLIFYGVSFDGIKKLFHNKSDRVTGASPMSRPNYLQVFAALMAFLIWLTMPQPALSCSISFHQGVEALQTRQFEDAVRAFSVAIDADQNQPLAYANRCLAQLELAHYLEAIADCTVSLNQRPNQSEVLLNRGLAYYRTGNYQAAIADNTTLLRTHPDVRAYFNRGLAKVALQQYWQALIDYDRALAQQPEDQSTIAEIYIDRGVAYFALQQMPQAIDDFSQAIALNTQDERAYYTRGCLYRWQGNFAAAIADFTTAIALQPDHAGAYLDRGIAQAQMGRAVRALSDLKNAASLFEQHGHTIAYQQTVTLIQQLQSTRQTAMG